MLRVPLSQPQKRHIQPKRYAKYTPNMVDRINKILYHCDKEKRMTNDFNYFFYDMMQNLEKSGHIINDKYIKKLLENWNIKEFRFDENGSVTNEYAKKEIGKIFEKIVLSMSFNDMYTIIGMNKMAIDSATKDYLCGNTLSLCMFCFALHNYFIKKLNKPTNEELVFSNLTTSLLENIKGMIFSYMSNDFLTVIQKVRIIYECYVIFLFIDKHKELATPFLDHIKIIENRIFNNKSIYDDNEQLNKLKDDNEYLGWTKSIIAEKINRNLAYLAQDVGIDKEISLIYKLSSNYIHTNAYSAFIKNAINKDNIKIYLPFVTDMMIRQICVLLKNINKVNHQNEFINILLNRFQEYSHSLVII